MEICDQLGGKCQDPMLSKYNNRGSLRVMIHRTLAVMLQQRKVIRQSATTSRGGRSHRYVRTKDRQIFEASRTEDGRETDSSPVLAVTRAESSTERLHAQPTMPPQVNRPEGGSASPPAPSKPAVASDSGNIPFTNARLSSEQAPPRLAEGISEQPSEVRDECSTLQSCSAPGLRSDAPEGKVRESRLDERHQVQSSTSRTTASACHEPSSSLVDTVPSTGMTASISGRNSEARDRVTTGLVGRVSARSLEHVQEDTARKSSDTGDTPAHMETLTDAISDRRGARPTSGAGHSAQRLISHGNPEPPMEIPKPRTPLRDTPLPSLTDPRTGSLDRSPIPIDSPPTRQGGSQSLPQRVSSEDASSTPSLNAQMSIRTSHVQKSSVLVNNNVEGGQSYPAQHQIPPIGSNCENNSLPSLAIFSTPAQRSVPGVQVQPSFTAINPRRDAIARTSLPDLNSGTMVGGTARFTHDITSKAKHARTLDVAVHATNSPSDMCAPATADAPRSLHRDNQTPNDCFQPVLVPSAQQVVHDPQVRESQSTGISRQRVEKSRNVANNGRDEEILQRSKFEDKAPQFPMKETTNASDEPGKSHETKHRSGEDLSALELDKLVNQARKFRKLRQQWAEDVKMFEAKRQTAKLALDEALARRDTCIKLLGEREQDLEARRAQIVKLEHEVEVSRKHANQSRDGAWRLTIDCQTYAEAKSKAQEGCSNTDKELQGILAALDV